MMQMLSFFTFSSIATLNDKYFSTLKIKRNSLIASWDYRNWRREYICTRRVSVKSLWRKKQEANFQFLTHPNLLWCIFNTKIVRNTDNPNIYNIYKISLAKNEIKKVNVKYQNCVKDAFFIWLSTFWHIIITKLIVFLSFFLAWYTVTHNLSYDRLSTGIY